MVGEDGAMGARVDRIGRERVHGAEHEVREMRGNGVALEAACDLEERAEAERRSDVGFLGH